MVIGINLFLLKPLIVKVAVPIADMMYSDGYSKSLKPTEFSI